MSVLKYLAVDSSILTQPSALFAALPLQAHECYFSVSWVHYHCKTLMIYKQRF